MAARYVLCFDGTWNMPGPDPEASSTIQTNVVRFYNSVVTGTLPDGSTQKAWYDDGVGTDWYDRLTGGAFGWGLDRKICDGYRFLVDTYPVISAAEADQHQIFILGFSRGAYTARSLVGMIRNVGLLTKENIDRVEDAYALYRKRDDSADTPEAIDFRQRYARPISIHFLGVWDTVGALGIPLPALQWLNSTLYRFHDTELSGIVRNAAHAVAIDEHRIDYQATLWDKIPKECQTIEQRWFIGAHADVGGGYPTRQLSDISLQWMQEKAILGGLAIDPKDRPFLNDANWNAPVTDSYRQFLDGAYAATHPIYYRPIDLASDDQTMDVRVRTRSKNDPTYHPNNAGFPFDPSDANPSDGTGV